MRITLLPLSAIVVGLFSSTRASAQGVTASSYFGGTGDDALTGVAIGSDGSIFMAGNSTSADLGGATAKKLADGGGFVAKLDRTGTKVTWLSWVEKVGELRLTPSDEPIAAGATHLVKLAADGSSIVWTGAETGAVVAFDLASSGDIGVLGTKAYRFGSDGTTQKLAVDVGRSHPTGLAFDPTNEDLLLSGDHNAGFGTCGGPWRSPFIYRYDGTGTRTWKLYDFSGQAACDASSLAADSFFTRLLAEADGTIWATGGSDGGNTVLAHDPADLQKPNPAVASACFASPCYGWKGAAAPGFVARFKGSPAELDRATFVVAHFNTVPAACSCDVKQDDGSGARPNSAHLDFAFTTSKGEVVGAGASAWHYPTANAWYPDAAYTSGYPAVVSLLDRQLETMPMATMLPGTAGLGAAAYRGGRLVVVGKAPDNSAWTPPLGQEALARATVPATPANAALQPQYGGGTSDGYIYVACVTDETECGAAPPPALPPSGGSGGGGTGGGAAGSGGAVPSMDAPAGSDAGCGCRTAGSGRAASWGALVVAAVLVLVRRPVCRRPADGGIKASSIRGRLGL